MQNVPEECDVDIQLPLLEDLTVHYFRGDGEVMQRMLDAAKNLRTFDSYKLWSNKDIEFASNSLTDIRLHRSDALSTITLWAPRLQHLNVQACYSLDEINILEDHELKSDLPEGFTPTRFQITTLNANLSPELLVELRRNPRVIFGHGGDSNGSEGGGADGFFGGGGYPMDGGSHNPMEALFAHLQGMMAGQAMGEFSGGDFFDDDEESEWETTDGEYCSSAEEHDDDSVEYGDDYYSGGFAANPGVTITEILGENASGGSAPIGGNGVTITEIFDEDD